LLTSAFWVASNSAACILAFSSTNKLGFGAAPAAGIAAEGGTAIGVFQ
jgi:hypothetical protein